VAYWLDYSAAKLDGQTIKRAGYAGVIRYIDSPDNLGWKHTTKAEFASHRAAGLGVRMVMQTTTTASAGGFPTGVAHAKRALAGAKFLGYDGVIYFTNDRTTLPSPAEWQAYLLGAVSVLGRAKTGAYGFGNAMDAARDIVDHFWQAGRRSDVRAHVQVWQDNNTQVTVGGVLCDRNLILKPLTNPTPEDDDMQPTDEVKDPGPDRWGHTWLNTNQLMNNSSYGLAALGRKLDAATASVSALAQVIAKGTNDLTAEQVEAAVAKALRENTVEVDVHVSGKDAA